MKAAYPEAQISLYKNKTHNANKTSFDNIVDTINTLIKRKVEHDVLCT